MMKKKLVAVLLTCSMVAGMLSACGDTEDSSRKKDKTEDADDEEDDKDDDKDDDKGDNDKASAKKEVESILAGTIWEEEPWTYDPWTGTTVAVAEPTPEMPGEIIEEEVPWESYLLLDPATGKPYDLGGMEIIVRDWWSNPDYEPTNDYEEAREEYIEWIEEAYNFKITQMAISDWASSPMDFVDYVTTGGDDTNYVFTLRDDPAVTAAMSQGLMYDLSTLGCLDFTDEKFQKNKVHEQYVTNGRINCMAAGPSEPRTGIFFNKRLLIEAGIDPDSIYDMQADGTWTWQVWTDIMAKVQRDVNNDGVIDIYGFDANYSVPINAAVYSNASEYVGLENGKYVYKFEDPNTVLPLQWMTACFHDYALVRPDDAQWDYYKEAFMNAECVFLPEDAYCGMAGGWLQDMPDAQNGDVGFVMFPKGPAATDYTNCWNNNPVAIPACYDADRAWKIAFAYDLYTDEVPGFEAYVDMTYYRNGIFDDRSIDETIMMMMDKGMVTYHNLVPNLDLNEPFLWRFNAYTDVAAVLDGVRDTYKAWIDEANK